VKKRTWLAKGYGSFQSAWRTLEGIETVNMIRKGRVRWVAKGDILAEAQFIDKLFGIAGQNYSPLQQFRSRSRLTQNFATEPIRVVSSRRVNRCVRSEIEWEHVAYVKLFPSPEC
jgi:hypothetical protein